MTTTKRRLKTATLVEHAWKQKLKVRSIEKVKKEEQAKLTKLENEVIARLKEETLPSVKSTNAVATLGKREFLEVEDYGALSNYVHKTKSYDLFTNAVSIRAYRERINAGKKVPGLSLGSKPKLSLTKRTK